MSIFEKSAIHNHKFLISYFQTPHHAQKISLMNKHKTVRNHNL